MKTQRQCPGCGAVLQSDHPDALGYLPRHVLKSEQDELICQAAIESGIMARTRLIRINGMRSR